jgi:hypothetical protein
MLNPEGPAKDHPVTLPDDPACSPTCPPRFRQLSGNVIQVEPKQSRQGVTVSGSAA